MKYFKSFVLLFVFVSALFFISNLTVDAGYCAIDNWAFSSGLNENMRCADRPQFDTGPGLGCTEAPYYHLAKVMTCEWVDGVGGGGGVGMDIDVTANPEVIYPGQSSTITWWSAGTTSCDTGVLGSTAISGNVPVSPTQPFTPYPITCTGINGSIYDEGEVYVATVTFEKDSNHNLVKNVVKRLAGDPDSPVGIGRAYFQAVINSLPVGDYCILTNNATQVGNTFEEDELFQYRDIPNLPGSDNNFMIKCGPGDPPNPATYAYSSSTINIKGQSGTLSSSNPSCEIAIGANSCQVPLTWNTINPKNLTTNFFHWDNDDVSQHNTSGTNQYFTARGAGVFTVGQTTATTTVNTTNTVDGQSGPSSNVDNILDTEEITLNCASGSSWDGSKCASGLPDLVVSTGPMPTTAVAGQAKTFSAVILNQGGTFTTPTTFKNVFKTSTESDGTPLTGSYEVTKNALNQGQSVNISQPITFETAGTYYMSICADMNNGGNGTVNEGNEGNNCTAWTPITVSSFPDLVVSAGPMPTTAIPGVPKNFSAVILNQGATFTTPITFTNVFQRSNSNGGPVTNYYEAPGMDSLNGGESRNTSVPITFDTAGTYYLRVCADQNSVGNGTVNEGNEGNNCGAWTAITVSALPDLVVSAGPMPTTALPGVPKNFSAVILNQGSSPSTPETFQNIFRTATGFDGSGNPLGEQKYQVALSEILDPGESHNISQSISFPTAGTYYMQACADNDISWNGTVNEGNEGNNCGAWIAIYVSSLPDLVVSAGPVPTTAIGVNVSRTYSATILNQGGAPSTPETFQNIFRTATGFDGSGNPLGEQKYQVALSEILDPGESHDISKSISFSAEGTYYMQVCADNNTSWQGTVTESVETNNCGVWKTIIVTSGSLPDLTASGPNPTEAIVNVPVNFTSVITNTGSASTGTTFPNSFQKSSCLNGQCPIFPLVASTPTAMGPLTAGSTATAVSLPITYTQTGWVSIRACAANNTSMVPSIPESDEDNNCSDWVNVLVGGGVGAMPDLIASPPPQTSALVNVDRNYTSIISNIGNNTTGASFYNSFQKAGGSNGQFPDPTLIGSTPSPMLTLNEDRSDTATSLPIRFTSTGVKSIRACADSSGVITELDESNCSDWTNVTVTELGGLPDLIAYGVTPITAPAGNITFSATVKNDGISSTGGSFVNLFQSRPYGGGLVTHHTPALSMGALGAGETSTASKVIALTAGSYEVRICADKDSAGDQYGDIYPESNENNNCSEWTQVIVGGALPDLIASAPYPTEVLVGVDTTFYSTITNQGSQTTGIAFPNFVRRNDNPRGTGTYYPILEKNMEKLPKFSQRNLEFTHRFTTTGTYYVQVCADNDTRMIGKITESNEGNNCSDFATINVRENLSNPDLTAYAPTPTTAIPGVATTFSATIKNQGTASTGATKFNNLFQLSKSSGGSAIVEREVAASPVLSELGIGGTATVSAPFTLDRGIYYMRVCADKNSMGDPGLIPELDEENNCSEWTQITSGAKPDLTSSAPVPTTAVVGIPTQFSFIVKNSGMAPTEVEFKNLFQSATGFEVATENRIIKIARADTGDPIGLEDWIADGTILPMDVGEQAVARVTLIFNEEKTYYVRGCADKNSQEDQFGVISEINENDNCSEWTGVTVTKTEEKIPGGWTDWICGECSKPCDTGTQQCTRTCTNPPPQNGGLYCEGPDTMEQQCNTQACDVGGSGITFTADPSLIFKGKSSTLNWSTDPVADSCTGTGEGFNPSDPSGSIVVTPPITTTYGLTCTTGGVQTNATAKVRVINLNIFEN